MSDLGYDRWLGHDDPIDLSVVEIDAPTLPEAGNLLAFYNALRVDGALPKRSDIDPLTIPRELLTSVYMLEPIEDGNDWVYRLIGSSIVERFRVDRTGHSFRSFLPQESAEDLVGRSNRIAQAKDPVVFRLYSSGTVMDDFYAETLSLPLHDERSDKIWLFGGTFFGQVIIPRP